MDQVSKNFEKLKRPDYERLLHDLGKILHESPVGEAVFHDFNEMADSAVEILTAKDLGPKLEAWPQFSEAFGAFRPKEFTVFCGTSGTGKTTFLANISYHLAKKRVPHFVASIETGPADYALRMFSVFHGIDLNTGDFFEGNQAASIAEKCKQIVGKNNIYLSKYQSKINPKFLMCDLLHADRELGCKVAFIDNLNFLMPIVNEREAVSAMDTVVHDFVMLTKHLNMHIVMVMHPRKKEDDDGVARVENEYDIKGSSTVIQEAHNVLLFNRPTKGQEQEDGFIRKTFRELKFCKMRRRGMHVGRRVMFDGTMSKYLESPVRL